jgi:hypothetical protein
VWLKGNRETPNFAERRSRYKRYGASNQRRTWQDVYVLSAAQQAISRRNRNREQTPKAERVHLDNIPLCQSTVTSG